MKESLLSMINRTQNRIRGLDAQDDDIAAGQKMAYNRVLAELKILLEECKEEKK